MLPKHEAVAQLRDWLAKYDPNQPRVPAGSEAGGRWAAAGGGTMQHMTSSTVSFKMPIGVRAEAAPDGTPVLISEIRTSKAIFHLPAPGDEALVAAHGPEDADEKMMAKEYAKALDAVPARFRPDAATIPFGFVDSRLFQVADSGNYQVSRIEEASPEFIAVYSLADPDTYGVPRAIAMDSRALKMELGELPAGVKASDMVSAVFHHELGHFLDNKLGQQMYDDAAISGQLNASILANSGIRRNVMWSETNSTMRGRLAAAIQSDRRRMVLGPHIRMAMAAPTWQSRPEAFADAVAFLQGAKVLRGIPRKTFGEVFADTIETVRTTLGDEEGITFTPPVPRRRKAAVKKDDMGHDFEASLEPYESELRRTLPDGTVRIDFARRGPWGMSDGVRYERADGSPIRKYDPNQPREPSGSEEGGRWTDSGGSGGGTATATAAAGATDSALSPASQKLLTEITSTSIADRRKTFEGDDPEGRRKLEQLADPANTIGRLMKSHVPNAGDWSEDEHENFSVSVAGRIDGWIKDGIVASDTGEILKRFAIDLHTDLILAGSDKATALRLAQHTTDIMAAQEVEALGRTLGDHGIRHLTQDAVMAMDVLKALPGTHENDPAQRAAIRIAAAFHDAGYMTPPARVFLDRFHPDWGETYYKAHVAADVQRALGSATSALVQRTIKTHADTDFDWKREPIESAFRTADNLALFQHEKLPALLRYVPSNVRVAEELGKGTITEIEARRRASANIAAAGLPARLSRQLTKAAGELTTIFPKLTLGMFGGRYEGVRWSGDSLQVNLRRASSESAFLRRISDLHSRQFMKFAEGYLGKKHPALTDATNGRDFEIVSPRSRSRMRVAFLGANVVKLLDDIRTLFAGLR